MEHLANLMDCGRSAWGLLASANTPDRVLRLKLPFLIDDMRDEDVLRFPFVVLMMMSAMLRLHVFLWDARSLRLPFSRAVVGKLRRRWIPFCLMDPTPKAFPPPLPDELSSILVDDKDEYDALSSDLARWIFLEDGEALEAFRSRFATADRIRDKSM